MKVFGWALAALFVSGLGQAQPTAFDDLLAKWTSGARPGIAVAVVRDGHTTYVRTLGYADVKAAVPVTRNTRFLAGSRFVPEFPE